MDCGEGREEHGLLLLESLVVEFAVHVFCYTSALSLFI